mgnify:FL=1
MTRVGMQTLLDSAEVQALAQLCRMKRRSTVQICDALSRNCGLLQARQKRLGDELADMYDCCHHFLVCRHGFGSRNLHHWCCLDYLSWAHAMSNLGARLEDLVSRVEPTAFFYLERVPHHCAVVGRAMTLNKACPVMMQCTSFTVAAVTCVQINTLAR